MNTCRFQIGSRLFTSSTSSAHTAKASPRWAALTAQAQDRPRQSSILAIITAGGHQGVLPTVMQRSVGLLSKGDSQTNAAFVEALLTLVTNLATSTSGCTALREAFNGPCYLVQIGA